MEHFEDFELEKEYCELWRKLKVLREDRLKEAFGEIKQAIKENKNIIESLEKAFLKSTCYFSKDAFEVISLCHNKYEKVYKKRKCIRKLKYIGDTHAYFINGHIYKSSYFTGAVYTININGKDKKIGSSYFERVS